MKSTIVSEILQGAKQIYLGDVLVAPPAPAMGIVIYQIGDVLYTKNAAGVQTAISGGGGGGSAPALVYDVSPSGTPYATIQAAINAALLIGEGQNALIRVFPGTYTENITVYSGMTIQGQKEAMFLAPGGVAEVTLMGSITYLNSPTPSAVRTFKIENLILGGDASMSDGSVPTRLIFEGCTFPKTTLDGNNAAYSFTSVGTTNSYIQFRKCLITGVLVSASSRHIRISGSMRAFFQECFSPMTINGTGVSLGSAVYGDGAGFMFLKDCEFESGSAQGGTVFFNNPSAGSVVNCKIKNYSNVNGQRSCVASATVGRVEVSGCFLQSQTPIGGVNNDVYVGPNTLVTDGNLAFLATELGKEYKPSYSMESLTLAVTTNLATVTPYFQRHIITSQVAPITLTLRAGLDNLGKANFQWISNRGTGNVTVAPPAGGTTLEAVGVTLMPGESNLYIYDPTGNTYRVAARYSAPVATPDPRTSQTRKLLIDYAALVLAGPETVLTAAPYVLFPGSYMEYVSAYLVAPFDAPNLTSAILRVGDNTILNKYVNLEMALQAAVPAAVGDSQTWDEGFAPPSSYLLNIDITLDGDTADNLTQGQVEILVKLYDRQNAAVDFIPALT